MPKGLFDGRPAAKRSPITLTKPVGRKLAARAMRQKTANPFIHLSDFAS